MAIHYKIEVEDRIIHVTTWGFDESLKDVMAYGQAVIEACREHQCTHVLTDERKLDYNLSTIDTYELAKYYAGAVSSLVKIAIVCSPDNFVDGKFWETVGQNRGLTVRVFTDVEQAHRWLGI